MPIPCESDDKETRNYYRYYDTPEGCDIPRKVGVTARYGIITGVILSTYDVLMYSHATGFGSMLQRYMYHIVPLGLIGATFSVVANGLVHLREKDDCLNYFLGGLACGPIVGTYLRSKHAVLLGGLALGVAGFVKKDAIDNCYTLFPHAQGYMRSITWWRHDYTLVKDPRDEMIETCEPKK